MPSSNRTGLVLKITIALVILLAVVVYKLNDYFKNEQISASETRLHQKLILTKAAVSSQLSQIRNTLSAYELGMEEASINWVQLDPFFAIARIENINQSLKVSQIFTRTGTAAERWNAQFLEQALKVNIAQKQAPIMAQVFQNKAGTKFLILRFEVGNSQELVLAGGVEYFQKFFDLERGENSTSLLATTDDVLVAHSIGDYISTKTQETRFSKKKYLSEKDEISGTNLLIMNYILKTKMASAFAMPWSIVGVVAGVGCILIAILFYGLDPIERKVERYKRQERAQIYKDTLGGLISKSTIPSLSAEAVQEESPQAKSQQSEPDEDTFVPEAHQKTADSTEQHLEEKIESKIEVSKDFFAFDNEKNEVPMASANPEKTNELVKTMTFDDVEETLKKELSSSASQEKDKFLALEEPSMDITDIEKALALDDFDSEASEASPAEAEISMQNLKENLSPQKISVAPGSGIIDRPQFSLTKKEYKVDSFKVHIRIPERKNTETKDEL